MKLKAYDKVREQFIPQEDFALTGDGRILIATNLSHLLAPRGLPSGAFEPSDEVPDDSVEITIEE